MEGERLEPWRARPVPFWRNGLAPPPRTSALVKVDWVPARLAASWAVTTWCSTARLGSRPKMVGSRSTGPRSWPAALRLVTVRVTGSGRSLAIVWRSTVPVRSPSVAVAVIVTSRPCSGP